MELVDGSSAIDKTTVSAQLDGVAVTPGATVDKAGNVTSVDFSSSTPFTPGVHTAALVYTEGAGKVTSSWRFTVGKYVTLDPAWRVTGSTPPNPDLTGTFLPIPTAETRPTPSSGRRTDLSLLAVDATGAPLPNLADPTAKGAAIAAAAPPNPANAPLHFEIEGMINLDATQNMPGSPSTDRSANGQAAEILTYLTLPAGVITMVVNHDDAFQHLPPAQIPRTRLAGSNWVLMPAPRPPASTSWFSKLVPIRSAPCGRMAVVVPSYGGIPSSQTAQTSWSTIWPMGAFPPFAQRRLLQGPT